MECFTGIRVATATAGIKREGSDFLLIQLPPESRTVAVFTRNRFAAAPVVVSRNHLGFTQKTRYFAVNSGNANCGLGECGQQVVEDSVIEIAKIHDCDPHQVLAFSTGVINKPLPFALLQRGIHLCSKRLGEDDLDDAARAIMTTDTRPKKAMRQLDVEGQQLYIEGIAKGSGMICPDMATMLAFIFTDVHMPTGLLDQALRHACECSFNRATVDGDTSTNDACTLTATGHSKVVIESTRSPLWQRWLQALTDLCQQLACEVVRDGEGATRFITITIDGGGNDEECLLAARAIAHSPLVKTAFFGQDPNLGRIAAALGRCGIDDLDFSAVNMYLGDIPFMIKGSLSPEWDEQLLGAEMRKEGIDLLIFLGRGKCSQTLWTCDLSYDYIRINADYRS